MTHIRTLAGVMRSADRLFYYKTQKAMERKEGEDGERKSYICKIVKLATCIKRKEKCENVFH